MKRIGAAILSVCVSATLFLATQVPSYAQKPNGGSGTQAGDGGKVLENPNIPPAPKGIIKQEPVKAESRISGKRIPGVPARNVLKSPIKGTNLRIGPHGPFTIETLRERQKKASISRGGPPQDRDVSLSPADVIQPRFAQGDTRIWCASNATGVDKSTGRLAYDGASIAYHVWAMDTEGRNPSQLTGNDNLAPKEKTGEQQYPDVNRATNVLAYCHRDNPGGGDFGVYVRFLGTNKAPIRVGLDPLNPLGDSIHPTLDPSGQFLAFSAKPGPNGKYGLYYARIDGQVFPDGKFVRQLSDGLGGTVDDLDPAWSPDGTRIAFTRRDASGGERIFILLIGGPALQYTNYVSGTAAKDRDPNWRSDGARIEFASTRKCFVSGALAIRLPATNVGTTYDIYEFNPAAPEDPSVNRPIAYTADPADGTGEQGATDPVEAYKQNEFAYVSDRDNPPVGDANRDIWIGLYNDLTPPLLEEIPKVFFNGVETREGLPGQGLTIAANVTDLQTGVQFVYAQFKDPDGYEFDGEGVEHRLYFNLPGDIPAPFGQRAFPTTGSQMDLFVELAQEVVNPFTFGYAYPWILFIGPVGSADLKDGLRLWDDGPISGGGHEPEGQTANDSLFTQTWVTPYQASDFYFDLLVQDVAGNQLVYDNIGGFTTKLFSSLNPILFVADYIAGQLFVQDLNYDPLLGQLFARTTWEPTESYWTRNPATHGLHAVFYNTAGVPAYSYWPYATASPLDRIGETADTLGPAAPYQQCDIWRTQCRNPIPLTVLAQYLPSIDQQVDPNNPTKTRAVTVAERAVVWANPYTKDLYTAPVGLDIFETQQTIKQFLDAGGRMVLSGQDVAWGLTQNGQVGNDLLLNYFRINFVDDVPADVAQAVYTGLRHNIIARANDVVATGPWDYHWIRPDGEIDPYANILAEPAQLLKTPLGLQLDTPATVIKDAALNQLWIDAIAPNGTDLQGTLWSVYAYTANGSELAAVAQKDGGKNSRTFFMAYGMEGIQSNHVIVSTPIGDFAYSDSRRYEMLHGALCWMRTARAYGKVEAIDPQTQQKKPEPGVLVRFTTGNGKDPDTIGQVLGAALTDSQGNYIITGLPPGHYFVDAVKPGFRIQHPEVIRGIHGGEVERQLALDINVLNLIITKEPPGSVSGRVVNDNGDAVQNVTVTLTSVFPGIIPVQALTDDKGAFKITVGAGDWVVTVDGTALGYGATSQPTSVTVRVVSGLDTIVDTGNPTPPGKDAFILFGITGNIKGNVTRSDTLAPLPGAQVVATVTRFGQLVSYGPVVTDANGDYDFAASGISLPPSVPGSYTLTASAFGFKTRNDLTVSLASGATVTDDFALDPVTARTLRGYVKTKLSGNTFQDAPAGVKVIVKLNGIEVCQVNTFEPSIVSGGSRYNFEFLAPGCKLGDNINKYELVVDASGFGLKAPGSIQISVPDGDTPADGLPKYSPDIILEPLHTFAKFNELVSFPYNYAGKDPKVILNGGTGFRFATWDNTTKLFRNYPAPPANDAQLGRGYFLQNDLNMALTTPGTPADTSTYFPIQLKKGWNLIGNPFPYEVRLESSLVSGPGGVVTFNEAVTGNLISPAIWSVESGVAVVRFSLLEWFGYWVLAYQDVTLLVDPNGKPFTALGNNNILALNDLVNPTNGWRLNIQASTDRGMQDKASFLGVSPSATEGFDTRYDLRRPPAFDGDFVKVNFKHEDWGELAGDYASDVRGISPLPTTWRMTVESNQVGANVTVRWPSMSSMSRNVNLVLVDEKSGKRQFMRSTSSYSFKMDESGVRPFRIETIGAGRVLRVTNPVSQTTRGGASMSFALSTQAAVEVTVLGPGGKSVKRIMSTVSAQAGTQTVTWDGRDNAGIAVPPGAYTIEIRATTDDGQIVRVVTPVVLKR